MEKNKILAIVGSLRKASLNRQLALIVKDIIGDRADFELLEYDDVPMMNEDIEFPAPDSVKRVREKVKSADAIWFFTPEHNHYFSSVLKNIIDWLSRSVSEQEPQVLARKPACVSGISLGMAGTALAQDHLITLINFLDMDVMNVPRVTIPNAMQMMDNHGKLTLNETSYSFLKDQTETFLEFVKNRVKK
ncbi:MAG: NAD(P)H-dependent oxidoreductase [Clostridiaceae bacterium]|nr:NAD(P)H-dependent oxidoreductase [Clostridiaceae bacterium]